MLDFEKEFKEMFADLLSNPDVIKEAEEEAEAELKAYRAKKQAEFERSETYKKARKAAIQQLKEQKLSEGMASIDKEFEAKTAQMTNFLNNPTKLSSKNEAEEKEKHPLTSEERSKIMKDAWAKKTPEEKAAIAAKRKITTARNKAIKAMNEDLDSAALSIIFDNAGNLYSSDNIQELVKGYNVNNAKDLTHEQVQTLIASVINDDFITSGHIKKSLLNATNQMYSSEAIAQYVEEAINANPDATVGNGVITTRSEEEQKRPDDIFDF